MLKPVTKNACVSTVSLDDSAIDIAASDMTAYGDASLKDPGVWRELLKIKDGETPTVFVIGVVPSDLIVRIEDECNIGKDSLRSEELRWRCFLHGVREIQGWPGEPPKTRDVNGVTYVAPEWLKENFNRELKKVALEIGAKVFLWNQLGDNDIKN